MASLTTLPAEVQKTTIALLDYASLCMLRSANRYFYKFLTEAEIHQTFMNTPVEHVHVGPPKDGHSCVSCLEYCEATASQIKRTDRKQKQAPKDIDMAQNKVTEAYKEVRKAWHTVTAAKAGAKKAKVKGEKTKKRKQVAEAETKAKEARKLAKALQVEVQAAIRAKSVAITASAELARTCGQCKRRYNGFKKPGVLITNEPAQHHYLAMTCSRTGHYNRRWSHEENAQNMQSTGTICTACWKGTSRGTSGMARRMAFIEEYGYWLRQTWIAAGQAVNDQLQALAQVTFEEIQQKEQIKEEAESDEN